MAKKRTRKNLRRRGETAAEYAARQEGYYKRADGMWTDDAPVLRGWGIEPNVYLSAEEVCREERIRY